MIPKIFLFAIKLGTFKGDMWFAIFLVVAILIFAWSKKKIVDARAALLFVIMIMILVFYQHPDLIWVTTGVYLFITFGKGMFKL